MNFIHNRISNPLGTGLTFEEWMQKTLAKQAEGRVAKPEEDGSRGEGRGQVINTEGEQDMTNDPNKNAGQSQAEGKKEVKKEKKEDKKEDKKEASSSQKTIEAKCGKEMGESSDAGKVTEKHTDASPGDDENPNPKVLINNDPNYQKGESVNPGKVDGKNKKQPGEPVAKGNGKKANTSPAFKKVASLNRQEKLGMFAYLSSQKHNPIEYVEAAVGLKFANMTPEEKSWFVDFWKVLYPEDYVKEMAKDR